MNEAHTIFSVQGKSAGAIATIVLNYLHTLPSSDPIDLRCFKQADDICIIECKYLAREADALDDVVRDLRIAAAAVAAGVLSAHGPNGMCSCPDSKHIPFGCPERAHRQIGELWVCDDCRACYESDPAYFPYVPGAAELKLTQK